MGEPIGPVGGQHLSGVSPEGHGDLKEPSQGQTSTRSVKKASPAVPQSTQPGKPGAEPVDVNARNVEPSNAKPVPGLKPAEQGSQNEKVLKQQLDRLLDENGSLAKAFLKREEHKVVKGSVGVLGRVKSELAQLKEGVSSQQKFKAFVKAVKPETLPQGLSVKITLNDEGVPLSLIPPDKQLADREDLEALIELAVEILEGHLKKPEFSEAAMAELNQNIARWEAQAREIGQTLGLDREEEQKLRFSGMVEQSLEKLRTRQVVVTIGGGDPAKRKDASDEVPESGCRVRITQDPEPESAIDEEDEQALMELLGDQEEQEQTKLKGLWEGEQARKLERDERLRGQAKAGHDVDDQVFNRARDSHEQMADQFKPYRPKVDERGNEDALSMVSAPSLAVSVDEPATIAGRELKERREKLKNEEKSDQKEVDLMVEQQKMNMRQVMGEFERRQQKGSPGPASSELRHSEGMPPVERSMPVHGPSVEDDEEGAESDVSDLCLESLFESSPVQAVKEPSGSEEEPVGALVPFYLDYRGKSAEQQAEQILMKADEVFQSTSGLKGVAITYSANHQQTGHILNTYQNGQWKTGTQGAAQADVMKAMEGLMENKYKHLQHKVRIAPISTMPYGGGGAVASLEQVDVGLDNLKELLDAGWQVLGWQNHERTLKGRSDSPYAIGGGVGGSSFFKTEQSKRIQGRLRELEAEYPRE